jgi:hypothetical protein
MSLEIRTTSRMSALTFMAFTRVACDNRRRSEFPLRAPGTRNPSCGQGSALVERPPLPGLHVALALLTPEQSWHGRSQQAGFGPRFRDLVPNWACRRTGAWKCRAGELRTTTVMQPAASAANIELVAWAGSGRGNSRSEEVARGHCICHDAIGQTNAPRRMHHFSFLQPLRSGQVARGSSRSAIAPQRH